MVHIPLPLFSSLPLPASDGLRDLLQDLYTDFCKLSGISAPKQRLPALEQLLGDPKSTLEQVMEFMLNR